MKQIAPHIYVEHGYHGVTVGCIVTDSGVICIDSPTLPAHARAWRAQIAKHTDRPICFVVLTDGQRDRIASLQYLGGVVVAHKAALETIKNYGDTVRQQVDDSLPNSSDADDWRITLPQITFTDKLVLYKDAPIVIQRVGGATEGSVWVHLPQQGVLFMGDLLAFRAHPATSEGDLATWLDLLNKVGDKSFAAKTLVPGRGGPCNKAALEPMADYLRAMRARVQSLLRLRRPRAETALLVREFLARYPVSENEREFAERRIKAGLDHIYDMLKSKK